MIRPLRWVGILAALGYCTYLSTLAPNVAYLIVTVLAYVATGYVLWRALPAIRADLRFVTTRYGRRRRVGGHL